ncbi:hypothetical protein INR49_019734 [Caranx melampygus]|nr:hypothetical protein INR49_019734 [Caranx melampygus]
MTGECTVFSAVWQGLLFCLGLCSHANEELGSVGVGPSISHGQYPWTRVLQLEVLISKLLSIDGFASSSVVVGKVPALKNKVESAQVATEATNPFSDVKSELLAYLQSLGPHQDGAATQRLTLVGNVTAEARGRWTSTDSSTR